METLETYGTISTAQVAQRRNSLCHSIFRRRCFPSLMDSQWNASSSSSSSSLGNESSSQDTAFMPWDEYHHQTVVKSMVQATATRWCNSRTCPACRSSTVTRFVAATRPAPPRLVPKWWESSTLATALADQLGEWVESQLTCNGGMKTSKEERRFWREMEADDDDDEKHDDTSTVPYDEKEDDPRYASF